MTRAFSWQNSISLCPASFCTSKPNLPVIPGICKIMASTPVTSWQIDGETVADFISLDSKITADGDCNHEIKRHLLLEAEQFYEDLQDLLEWIPMKDVLFIIGDWNAKAGSQEIPGVTGKFGLGIWNEAGQRLIEFCQENALVIANTLF